MKSFDIGKVADYMINMKLIYTWLHSVDIYIQSWLFESSYLYEQSNTETRIGLIAHELQEIYPELVNGVKDCPVLQSIN